MADISDIFNMDRGLFSRLYKNNKSFRDFISTQIESNLSPASTLEAANTGRRNIMSSLLPKMRYHEQNGEVGFIFGPSGDFIKNEAGESLSQTFRRAEATLTKGGIGAISTSTTYTGSRLTASLSQFKSQTERTGPYVNRRLETIAQQSGLRIEKRTISTGLAATLNLENDPHAFIIPDSDVTTVLKFFDGNKAVSVDRVHDILGITGVSKGTVAKRMKALTNDRALETVKWVKGAPDQRLKAAVFDSVKFMQQDTQTKALVQSLFKGDFKGQEKFYEKMMDGISIMSEESANRMIKNLADEAYQLEKIGEGKVLASERKIYFDHANTIKEKIKLIEEGINEGGSFNFRGNNFQDIGAKYLTNQKQISEIQHIKGNVVIMKADAQIEIMKKMPEYANMSEKQLRQLVKEMDVLVARQGIKEELNFANLSWMTLEKDSRAKTAYVNVLTASSYDSLLNHDDFLSQSLAAETKSMIESVEQGIYSPGLRSLVQDMIKSEIPDDISAADAAKLESSRHYAKEFHAFMEGGGDLSTNPNMIKNIMSSINEHFFAYKEGRYGQEISIGGENVPYLGLKTPMAMSSRAHITIDPFAVFGKKAQSGMDMIRGTIRMDSSINMFVMHPYDVAKFYKAFGGFDLDDSLYSVYQYDSTAKRLMSLTLRDPNEVGEYAFFDADIIYDKKFSKQIRELASKRKTIQSQILGAEGKNPATKNRLIKELNDINDQLHNEFMADERIKKVDLVSKYENEFNKLYSPAGLETQLDRYGSGSSHVLLGYGQVDSKLTHKQLISNSAEDVQMFKEISSEEAIKRLKKIKEYAHLSEEQLGQLGYSEYAHDSGFFVDPRALQTDPNVLAKLFPTGAEKVEPLTSSVLSKQMSERLSELYGSEGLLGQVINQTSGVIDPFIGANKNIENLMKLGLKKDQAESAINKFKEIIANTKLQRLDREALIDAFTKMGGGKEVQDMVKDMLHYNYKSMGSIMAQMQNYLEDQGIDLNIGLDEFLFKTRFNQANAQDTVDAYNAARAAAGKSEIKSAKELMLGKDDPRAAASALFESHMEQRAKSMYKTEEIMRKASEKIETQLLADVTPTAQQQKISQELMDTYTRARKEIAEYQARSSEEKIAMTKELEGLNLTNDEIDHLLFQKDQGYINTQMMLKLNEHGLLDDANRPQLMEQMRAFEKELVERANAPGADIGRTLAPLDLTSIEKNGVGISNLRQWARQEHSTRKILDELHAIQSEDFLNPSINKLLKEEGGKIVFNSDVKGINEIAVKAQLLHEASSLRIDAAKTLRQARSLPSVDPLHLADAQSAFDQIHEVVGHLQSSLTKSTRNAAKSALIDTQQAARSVGRMGYIKKIRGQVKKSEMTGAAGDDAFDAFIDTEEVVQRTLSDMAYYAEKTPTIDPKVFGTLRYAERTSADHAANRIITGADTVMKGSKKAAAGMKGLMEIPLFRKGVMAAGVFAAIGITYGIIKGRTPEDMQGPPLLPGGSAYEDYNSDSSNPMSSMYSMASARGMSEGSLYQVNISGISNPEEFRSKLSKITGSSVNSTIYNTRKTINPSMNSRQTLQSRLGLNA